MRILHINTLSNGGAFNGAYRVHCALLKMGIKSKLLVLEDSGLKSNQLKEVYVYNHPQIKTNILNRFSTLLGKPVTARQKRKSETKNLFGKFEIISFPFSDYDITQSPLYQEAEIINLHWVGDFLDYTSFFRKNTKLHIPLYIRSRFPVISVHCLFKNGIVNVKLILFSQTLSFQLESDRFMHNPVEACLCNQFISNHVIPVGNRKLTRDYQ